MQTEENARLNEFVTASKSRGASDEFLATFLIRRGWPADQVYEALGQYWENVTGIAVPERAGSGESARDAFLYLLSFATLATWATALGALLFDFINHWLPDPVSRMEIYGLRNTITWEMARMVIAFPIYLLVTRLTVREARDHPERLRSGVRKWLTYIALLATALTMIFDLIWFLNNLLAGEITTRFLLKSATVMIIAGAIFAYYLSALKWKPVDVTRARLRNLTFASGSGIAVIVTFVVGLMLAGTPSAQRHEGADAQRVRDLQTIANDVKLWHDREQLASGKATVPVLLNELGPGVPVLTDPETHAIYEYHPRSGTTYELCANFDSTSSATPDPYEPSFSYFWKHGPGRTCFLLDATRAVP